MHKEPAFIREAVALVVLVFFFLFLVIELQTQVSRFQRLLLLQHLKKSRRKRLILLQIALRKTRRARRVCHSHVRETNSGLKPFYTEIFWNFCFLPWLVGRSKTNVKNEVAKTWSNETDAIWTPREVKYYATASGYICHLDLGYRPKPCLITHRQPKLASLESV